MNADEGAEFEEIDFEGEQSTKGGEKITEFLFCVQNIGTFDKKEETYKKGPECEMNLRDIHRFLRSENSQAMKFNFLNWDVGNSDLFPLLLKYKEEEKVLKLCLVIIDDVIEGYDPSDFGEIKLKKMIISFIEQIIKNNILEIISEIIGNSSKVILEAKKKLEEIKKDKNPENANDNQVEERKQNVKIENNESSIELVFDIIAKICSALENDESLFQHYVELLTKLSSLKILDAIVYYTSFYNDIENNQIIKKISPSLITIVSSLTVFFTPDFLINYSPSNSQGLNTLKTLIEKEEQEKRERKRLMSTRSNSFGTRFKIFRPLDNTKIIATSVNEILYNKQQFINEKTNTFQDQKHKPKKKIRKKNVNVENEKLKYRVLSNMKLKKDFVYSLEISGSVTELIPFIKSFFDLLLENSINAMVEYAYFELGKEIELTHIDLYTVLNILSFFLEYNRLVNYKKVKLAKSKEEEQRFSFEEVASIISGNMINYFHNFIYMSIFEKKNSPLIYPALNYFKGALYACLDSFKYQTNKTEGDNLEINVIIQDNLLNKDFTKILRAAYTLCDDSLVLYPLIEFTELYYKVMETMCQRRQMKIVKKVIHKEKDSEGGSDSESNEDSIKVIERDVDITNEMKNLVDYDIINKLISIFQNDSTMNNSFDLSKKLIELKNDPCRVVGFLTQIFDRIVNKCNCGWIFFQMSYLITFNNLLNNNVFKGDDSYKKLKAIINKIVDSFFETLQKNKMLPIESLFQFSSVNLSSIMSGYEEEVPVQNESPTRNTFVPEEGEQYLY